jgi:formylglycine-generating enzyme required for sulfatase activity
VPSTLTVATREFLAARFEVTCAEYWEFLEDPRTSEEIEAHGRMRFVPRFQGLALARPAPDAPGRFEPPDAPEHPVAHLSLYDLVGYPPAADGEPEPTDEVIREIVDALERSDTIGWGYLRWRTERSRERARRAAEGSPVEPDVALVRESGGAVRPRALRFTLPTEAEWVRMARGGGGRRFVYGDEREWLCFKGVRSRPTHPAPEPIGLFPEDESVFGVRDLTGSVSEWTSGFHAERRVFWVKGHSWGSRVHGDDRIEARQAARPAEERSTTGIRLVVRVLESP